MVDPADAQRFLAVVRADQRCSRVTDVRLQSGEQVLLDHSTTGGAPRDLFSVTKVMLALVAGQAVEQGHLELDRPVRSHAGMAEFVGLGEQTPRHLLSLRRGAQADGAFDLDRIAVEEPNWALAFSRSPQQRPPGSAFSYDNGAYQVLAEVLQRGLPGGLAAFAQRWLFDPLGIGEPQWLRDPSGTPSGSAHLWLPAAALARIGELLLGAGEVAGERIVSPGWLAQLSRQSSGGGPPEHRPYGMGLWLDPDGAYFAAGWAGQLLYCRPADELVLVTLADPEFDYGPPARDAMPADWLAPLVLARQLLL